MVNPRAGTRIFTHRTRPPYRPQPTSIQCSPVLRIKALPDLLSARPAFHTATPSLCSPGLISPCAAQSQSRPTNPRPVHAAAVYAQRPLDMATLAAARHAVQQSTPETSVSDAPASFCLLRCLPATPCAVPPPPRGRRAGGILKTPSQHITPSRASGGHGNGRPRRRVRRCCKEDPAVQGAGAAQARRGATHLDSVERVQAQVVDEVRGRGDLGRVHVLEILDNIEHARRYLLLRQEPPRCKRARPQSGRDSEGRSRRRGARRHAHRGVDKGAAGRVAEC